MAVRGRFDEAIALVEYLAHDPHDGKKVAAVLALLHRMREAASKAKAPAT